MRWFAGSDHAAVPLRRQLVALLRALGDEVEDLGTDGEASVDYPDYGAMVGREVAAARARHEDDVFGLVLCGTGIGISIAANKVPGVRCALCHEAFTAQMSRAHNDANVVALGARVVGSGVAETIVRVFRATPFEGGRHANRVAKITALEGGG
ncbi:MAG: ribose 5-phosphate isomerase B [Kofleriaceae bacterium]|nr:ribose 5-phosphate isomerase B [Myxococcales bacterium]MCB9564082.1 ribose 5-phosphate isomerase B [Kofleriaceae bacterium]MCB9572550.1 ribose 5-phosphate isomerase B [Kofleriaceae bacterium]